MLVGGRFRDLEMEMRGDDVVEVERRNGIETERERRERERERRVSSLTVGEGGWMLRSNTAARWLFRESVVVVPRTSKFR